MYLNICSSLGIDCFSATYSCRFRRSCWTRCLWTRSTIAQIDFSQILPLKELVYLSFKLFNKRFLVNFVAYQWWTISFCTQSSAWCLTFVSSCDNMDIMVVFASNWSITLFLNQLVRKFPYNLLEGFSESISAN